ncbi:MAG: hypothetical protein ABFD29_01835 [Anaerolineaceae bacterium]
MPYTAFLSRIMPFHIDGTVIKVMDAVNGVTKTMSSQELAELNDIDFTLVNVGGDEDDTWCVVFFPELRDVNAIFATTQINGASGGYIGSISGMQGSSDTTNGLDGTWNNATVTAYPPAANELDSWRKSFKAISGCNGVKAIRFKCSADAWQSAYWVGLYVLHIYGTKTSGQTPEDILFLDAENSDAEYAIPQDFGDRPAATSITHQFKIKNAHPTETANNVILTVTDPDDIVRISTNGTNWVTSITLSSLSANTKSSVMYIKCETPVPPTPLGPKRGFISVTVGSWS